MSRNFVVKRKSKSKDLKINGTVEREEGVEESKSKQNEIVEEKPIEVSHTENNNEDSIPDECQLQKIKKRKSNNKEADVQLQTESKPHKEGSVTKKRKHNDHDTQNLISNEKNSPTKPIKNAFSFMMDNRHKVIGQNSPGKDEDKNAENCQKDDKRKLAARKIFLQNWSDAKGGKKRQQIDKELGKTIEYKMEQRAKRFKKMLQDQNCGNKTVDILDNSSSECNIISEITHAKKSFHQTNLSGFFETLNKRKSSEGNSRKSPDKVSLDENNKNVYNHISELTPSTKKKWKMRLRINLDSDEDTPTKHNKKSTESKSTKQKLTFDLTGSSTIAPIFKNALPKPMMDKETLEARRRFLESDLPDELKRVREKHKKLSNRELPIFPSISHIRVPPTEQQTNGSVDFWNLPPVTLEFQSETAFIPQVPELKLGSLTNHCKKEIGCSKSHFKKVTDIAGEIEKVKVDNPKYPVRKTFKFFSGAHSNSMTVKHENSTGVKQKTSKSEKLWLDLYKPHNSNDMFSNYTNVKSIKKWLQNWREFHLNRKRKHSGSSSDFACTDPDSGDNRDTRRDALILHGPLGSGKTSAVYSLCRELGIIIQESNASSKRTGKMLLQQLQQFVQSEDVQGIVDNYLGKDSDPKIMQLLLIEDVDVIFDQDEGFLNAVYQLISSRKLPVILTTTDINCLHLKKFMDNCTIRFNAVPPKVLTPWLQILCLVEGTCVTKKFVEDLLQDCDGDVRSTVLQLQYLIQSANELENLESNSVTSPDSFDAILGQHCETTPLNLGQIWWNVPQLLNIPQPLLSENAPDSTKKESSNTNVTSDSKSFPDSIKSSELLHETESADTKVTSDSESFLRILKTFDAFAVTDVLYNHCLDCDLEPVLNSDASFLKRSLDEDVSWDGCLFNRNLTVEMTRTLVNGCLTQAGAVENLELNRGSDEKRWRAKQHKCLDKFTNSVSLINRSDPRALTDIFSTLRCIAKSENARASTSNRRGNRFYHYFSGLGISVNDSILRSAVNVFSDT